MRDPTLDQTIMELSKFSVEQGKNVSFRLRKNP